MFGNISPAKQKLLIRLSIVLNLFLLLYLSLSAGWSLTSDTSAPSLPYGRDILNQYFEKSTSTQGSESLGASKLLSHNLLSQTPFNKSQPLSLLATQPFTISDSVNCFNKHIIFSQGMRGKYWVLYNYVRAARLFNCNETITYTTHGDFTFLDNLEPLLESHVTSVSTNENLLIYLQVGRSYIRGCVCSWI